MLESKSPNNVVKKIFEFAENRIIDEQNMMHKEIEELMMNNINEMENEIRLLKESYEDDISKFDDGNCYNNERGCLQRYYKKIEGRTCT